MTTVEKRIPVINVVPGKMYFINEMDTHYLVRGIWVTRNGRIALACEGMDLRTFWADDTVLVSEKINDKAGAEA